MPGLRNDPVHVIVNRKVLGQQIREKMYGVKTKSDAITVVYWANIIGYWVRRQVLTYSEVRETGNLLAERLQPDGPYGDGSLDLVLDRKLLRCLRGVLHAKAQAAEKATTSADKKALKEGTAQKRVHAWMKDALLSGRCPMCLQDVSEGDQCGHGYGRPQPDGKGGIVID